tara:strand:- start:72 stop:734 length:663 start_codon:yes stop_codon:yes gene_type:complete
MKKTFTVLLSFLFISFQAVKAEVGMGVTGAVHLFEASGTETVRESGNKVNGSHSEETLVPELFIEGFDDSGFAIGLSYIPTRSVGSKSRTDSSSSTPSQDSGTYKAEAELENVVQVYLDFPISEVSGFPIHGKVAVQHVTLKTLESLNSGSTYPDADLLGLTLGLGTKGDLPYGNNLYYKAEATYTDFEKYSADSTSSPANKVEADLEDIAIKFSIGAKF